MQQLRLNPSSFISSRFWNDQFIVTLRRIELTPQSPLIGSSRMTLQLFNKASGLLFGSKSFYRAIRLPRVSLALDSEPTVNCGSVPAAIKFCKGGRRERTGPRPHRLVDLWADGVCSAPRANSNHQLILRGRCDNIAYNVWVRA